MNAAKAKVPVIDHSSLPEFFQKQVTEAMDAKKLALNECTAFYIVNLLHEFSRADKLYREDSDALGVLFLTSAQDVPTEQRIQLLKRVGDVSLYIGGFFSDSLNRKLVDIDYYANLGGNAYANLTGLVGSAVFADLYAELAGKFCQLIDLLAHISETQRLTSNEDILRVYERWMQTGSSRLQQKLVDHGILPVEGEDDRKSVDGDGE